MFTFIFLYLYIFSFIINKHTNLYFKNNTIHIINISFLYSDEQKSLIQLEDHYREMFATDPHNHELSNKYLLLHKVFDHYDEYIRVPESSEEMKQPHILDKVINDNGKIKNGSNTIVTRDVFFRNWNDYTQGIFNGLDWSNIFCAGGCILGNLASHNFDKRGKDIDLFIYGVHSDDEANSVLKRIYDCVLKNTKEKGKGVHIIRTVNAVTIICSYPFRPVQIILRQYKTPAEVLLGFDIDSCTVGYDGTTNELYAMERFKRSMTKGYNLVNQSRRSTTYEQRLFKYSLRGFSVIIPGLRVDKIRKDLFDRNETLKSMRGLKKLLYYDHLSKTKKRNYLFNQESSIVKESDYSGDLDIPFGPNYDHERILKLLNYKDRKRFFAIIMNNKKARAKGEQPSTKPSRLIENILFDDSGKPIQQLTWIKETPAYQDLDNNHRRLMVGSFHLPPLDEKWDQGVYIDDNDDNNISNGGGSSSISKISTPSTTTEFKDTSSIISKFKSHLYSKSPQKASSTTTTTTSTSTGVSFQPDRFSPLSSSPKTSTSPSFGTSTLKSPSVIDKSKGKDFKKAKPKTFGGYIPSSSGPVSSQQSSLFGFNQSTTTTTPPLYNNNVGFGSDIGVSGKSVGSNKSSIQDTQQKTTFGGYIPSSSSSGPVSSQQSSLFNNVQPPTTSFDTSTPIVPSGYDLTTTSVHTPQSTSDKSSTPMSSKYGPQPGKIPPSFYYDTAPPSYYQDDNIQKSIQPPDYYQLDSSSIKQQQMQQSLLPSVSYHDTQHHSSLSSTSTSSDYTSTKPKPSSINIKEKPIVYKQIEQRDQINDQNDVYSNTQRSPTTKLLLLVDLCFKTGKITQEQKGRIKDLIIMDHPKLLNALDVFIIQHDVDDFVDTALRIVKASSNQQ